MFPTQSDRRHCQRDHHRCQYKRHNRHRHHRVYRHRRRHHHQHHCHQHHLYYRHCRRHHHRHFHHLHHHDHRYHRHRRLYCHHSHHNHHYFVTLPFFFYSINSMYCDSEVMTTFFIDYDRTTHPNLGMYNYSHIASNVLFV